MSQDMGMSKHLDIGKHPDIMELRERYDVASATPVAQAAEGLVLLAAFFLAASPWIVGFSALSAITIVDLIAGGALTVLAIALSATYGRLHGLAWLVPAIGVWTVVAPWSIVGGMNVTRVIWSNCFAGGAIVAVGLLLLVVGYLRAGRDGKARPPVA
jgi:SPW repeat